MVALNRPVIQAFPIQPNTQVFSSGVTDLEINTNRLIHLLADATVTVDFGSTTVSVDFPAGMDFTVSESAKKLSITGAFVMS